MKIINTVKNISLCVVGSVFLVVAQAVTAETTQLSFWTFRGQEKPLWDYINSKELIPGVSVEVSQVDPENYESKLRSAMQQKKGPDFFTSKAGANWLNPFLESNILIDMDQLNVDISNMHGETAVTGADGKFYAVPGSIQLQSIIYNEASLEELDMPVPTSLPMLKKLMQAAKKDGIVGLSIAGKDGWYLNQIMNEVVMAGLVNDKIQKGLIDGNKCFTDPEVVAAFDKVIAWKEFYNANPIADNYGAMRTAVASGKAVAMIDGAWSTGPTSPMYEINKDFVPVFAPIPGANSKVVAHADGGYAANSQSSERKAIQKVLQFMTTQTFAELFAQHVGEVPAYAGDFKISDKRVRNIAAILKKAASYEPFQAYSLNKEKPTYGSLSAEAYQKMLSGDLNAQGAAEFIQKGLNSWNYVGANNCKL